LSTSVIFHYQNDPTDGLNYRDYTGSMVPQNGSKFLSERTALHNKSQ